MPSYNGGKFPLSTFLAQRVREMVVEAGKVEQASRPRAGMAAHPGMAFDHPKSGQLLVETFPRGSKNYLVCYPFEGRLAHQTLGMLLTKRLERLRMRPLGFVANEYALAVWALRDMSGLAMDTLFDQDMLATTSMRGWAIPISTSAHSATARSSPG